MSQGFLTSADSTSMALEELGVRNEEIMRTELSPQTANTTGGGTTLVVTLENTGQTKLTDFDRWDLIIQYYDAGSSYHAIWLPYNSGIPNNNEWTVEGIYLNGEPESFEPDILNPGETIEVQAILSPSVGDNTTNLMVMSTPNGIPASIAFEH